MTSDRDAKMWLLMRRWRGPGSLGAETAGPMVGAASWGEETTMCTIVCKVPGRSSGANHLGVLTLCIERVFVCTREWIETHAK
jgi:hypothetical protein